VKVEFNSGVVDKLGAACRFLLKAQAAGAAVVVCGDRTTLDRLDQALWSFDPLSFVAHVRLKGSGVPAQALSCTPIWLVDDPAVIAARDILLNLGPAMVEGWETFERIVEIVSTEADDANAGRQRWRQYSALPGLDLVHQPRAANS
jgi:DNA polymerase III subunit chi